MTSQLPKGNNIDEMEPLTPYRDILDETFDDDSPSLGDTKILIHIFSKILRFSPAQLQKVKQWIDKHEIDTFQDFIYLFSYKYDETCKNDPFLSLTMIGRIKLFTLWTREWENEGLLLTNDTILRLDHTLFEKFRLNYIRENPISTTSTVSPMKTPSSTSSTISTASQLELSNFKKNIKRDATAFEVFKDETQYDTFLRGFQATARAQGLGNVIDPSFHIPKNDPFARELYKEQNVFMYAVLIRILQTDHSRSIIRDHEHTQDASAVLFALHKHQTESEIAKKEILRLTQYITTLRMTEHWSGTARQFLLHFKEKLRLLDALVPSSERIPESMRRALLTQAVESVPDLRRVRIMENLMHNSNGSTTTYANYFDLLMDAAFHHDQNIKNSSKRRNVHWTQTNDFTMTPNEEIVFEADDDIDQYQVHNTRTDKRRAPTTRAQTSSTSNVIRLPPELWSQIPPDVQSNIITHNRNLRTATGVETKTLQSNEHTQLTPDSAADTSDTVPTTEDCSQADPLFAMVHNSVLDSTPPVADITQVLSVNRAKHYPPIHNERHVTMHKLYVYARANQSPHQLIDRGANGGLCGSDMKVISKTNRKINIVGIDNHELTGLDVVTAATLLNTNQGIIVGIFNEYAYHGQGRSIHAPCQLEHFKVTVDDKSFRIGGTQRIATIDGYAIPLIIRDGLVYLQSAGIPSDKDIATLPQVIFTSPAEWNPAALDYEHTSEPPYIWDVSPSAPTAINPIFDCTGDFSRRVVATLSTLANVTPSPIHIHNFSQSKTDPDWEALRPHFCWTSAEHIKDTFAVTTRYAATAPSQDYLQKHFKARNPVFNIARRNEAVATDTIFSDTVAIHYGCKMAQIFVGRDTLVTDIYPIKSTKQFINALADNIRQRGAMHTIISDRGTYQISQKITDLLRSLFIADYQSEPYHQHQNKAENRYGTVKRWVNTLMNLTGCPPSCWFFCLEYACTILNHMSSTALGGKCPMQALTGTTPDISFCLYFQFWEPVYYHITNEESPSSFPSSSNERSARWIGFGDGVGDTLTWKLLTDDDNIVLYRSSVRSAVSSTPNLRLASPKGETLTPITKSSDTVFIHGRSDSLGKPMRTLNCDDLIGRTFLGSPLPSGEPCPLRIINKVTELSKSNTKRQEDIRFMVKAENNLIPDQIMSYNQILEFIQHDQQGQEDNTAYRFRAITAHQGPLTHLDHHYKGSKYNVLVEWETGETTYEPLSIIAEDDPITCAKYAKDNDLLDTPGWKQFKKYTHAAFQVVNAAKRSKIRQSKVLMKTQYGYLVPRTYEEAVMLDKQNGNRKWQDAVDLELQQISDYQTFKDYGIATWDQGKISNAPTGYKKIRVHLVFAVKHDGRHKARLVADGHLTEQPIESIYSGVSSIRAIRIALFLGVLNELSIWGVDIGNAYLEALTKELLYIIAGPEFGPLAGHILIIQKALYGLRSSGARWHDRLFDVLKEIGFTPCRAEPDVWLRKGKRDLYEYIAVYVDDLAMVMEDPKDFCDTLRNKFNLKLKGDGPLEYHLGCGYHRDPDGTLVADPKRYVEKILEYYEHTFNIKPRKVKTPLEPGDHPELDTSELCNEEDTRTYMTLIGQLQWLVTLGRFDIYSATVTMSSFRAAPRKGHLERAKRIFGYLYFLPHGAIRFRTGEPDYSTLPCQDFDWSRSVYGEVREAIPEDVPIPRGRYVVTTSYVDANLMHDMTTGKSLTAVLHIINGTPIDTYCKKQNTVETATYGSEYVAARTAVDQIIDLRTTLRYLGVPIRAVSYLFGDNRSVTTSSTIPHSIISKRHLMLSYHRVREAIAAKYLAFHWIDGKDNPADILSKHWEFVKIWPHLKALLFWRGEVAHSRPTMQTKGSSRISSVPSDNNGESG
jgi:hypothetical protein